MPGIVRDVTRARETTAHLQRLANILDATPDVVCSFKLDRRIKYANKAFRKLFAPQQEGELGSIETILSPFPDVWRVIAEVAIPKALENGFWKGDLDFVSDQMDAPYALTAVSHRGTGTRTDYISLMGHDIRARRSNIRALVEAREAADAASQAKGQFLATMSHEIRTPINGIIGAAELLLGTELTREQRDLGAILRDSSEALLDIVNDVLDISKIEANSLELEKIPFNLSVTIDRVRSVLGGAAARKGLGLSVAIDPEVPAWLVGDPVRLRQVFTNLVANAVKFTERGEVSIRVVQVERSNDGRADLHFAVSDTGIGIDPEAQSRIFRSFAQADGSMSRRFGGTGLGLAISRELVGLMGGELGVDSRVGEGSTFWFTAGFNVADGSLGPDKRLGDDAGSERLSPGPIFRLDARILVVEDNEVNRKVASAILGRIGCIPDIASDGFEAVRAVAATEYDLVFMDCQMPGMDGFEATRTIRANEAKGRHVTIVALTANATGSDQDRCLAAGMDGYLAKPVRIETLRASLAEWVPEREANSDEADTATVGREGPDADRSLRAANSSLGASSDATILDLPTIAAIRDLDPDHGPEMLDSIVDLFLDEADKQLAAIGTAVDKGDAAVLGSVAHTLKGAAGNVGAVLVGDLAATLESRGKLGSCECSDLVARLGPALASTRVAFLAERSASSDRP